MVIEIAQVESQPEQAAAFRAALQQARAVLEQADGYLGSTFLQGVERPETFVLIIKWTSVAAHMEGFRQGPLFAEWRRHFGHLLARPPIMFHYEVIAGEA